MREPLLREYASFEECQAARAENKNVFHLG
jgi:hypothetical protein